MVTQFVVTDTVMVMKLMKPVQTTVYLQGNALLAKLLTVTEQTNAGPKAGLVTASRIVMISSMALI
jgi:predicted transcriptional regulator